MKNHELLDLIGEVDEDYVRAADGKVIRLRFGWKTAAACAACAALVLGAYPVYRAAHPALHDYTVMEGGGMATLDDVKAPAGEQIDIPGQNPPAPNPVEPPRGDGPSAAYVGPNAAGESTLTPGMDIPADEPASDQYDRLLRGMGMHGEGADSYPDWFAGAWIDHGGDPDTPAWLTVAIVDGLRTPELEAEITLWCGDGVVFQSANYSHNFLDGLMEPVTKALDGTGLNCGIGVDVTANCLGVNLYSDGDSIPETVLAEFAKLDPAGDAIRVQVFTGELNTLTDDTKAMATPTPADGDAPARCELLSPDE